MTTVAAPTRYTSAEVARLSEQSGKVYELIQGELVEKNRMSFRSIRVATKIAFHLELQFPEERAHVVVEPPTYCFGDAGRMRVPDVALVWASRMRDQRPDDELRIVPDFVAEVVSPSNSHDELYDRIGEFLKAGVPLAWIVSPRHRFIHSCRHDGTSKVYGANDVIRDEPALPGFTVKVADCFPRFDGADE